MIKIEMDTDPQGNEHSSESRIVRGILELCEDNKYILVKHSEGYDKLVMCFQEYTREQLKELQVKRNQLNRQISTLKKVALKTN